MRLLLVLVLLYLGCVNDLRVGVLCSQFAYGPRGFLGVYLTGLDPRALGKVGFSMEKSTSNSPLQSSNFRDCLMERPSDKQLFRLYLEEKAARLKYLPGQSVIVHFENRVKQESFVFIDAEDEKTLRSFGIRIAEFFTEYLDSSQVESEKLSAEIVKVITSDENIHGEVVNMVKESGSPELAIHKTLGHLLSLANVGEEGEEGVIGDEHRRNRREAQQEPDSAEIVEFPENAADSGMVRDGVAEEESLINMDQEDVNQEPPLAPNARELENAPQKDSFRLDLLKKPNEEIDQKAEKPDKTAQREAGDEDQAADPGKEVQKVNGKFVDQIMVKKDIDAQVAKDDSAANNLVQSGAKIGLNVPVEGKQQDPSKNGSPEDSKKVVGVDAAPEEGKLNLQDPRKPLFSPTTMEAINEAISAYDTAQQGNRFRYVLVNGKVSLNFSVTFVDRVSPGAYDLIFHNCLKGPIDVSIAMVERNGNNYLSMGEQPLTILFLVFSLIYVLLSVVWGLHLRFSKAPVFRIHHLMLAMVIVKSISLMFHAINYFVIGMHGVQEEGWAVMDYIAHLTRGFLLIVTILMIGAGWTFIKHVFTRQEKQVFLIVIPLQVFANIATIVINETEQGAKRFALWNEIFTVVDLLCCAGVLFPVIWSIRHLRQAAQTDGKVAQNLRKLRLFRHFYILVICYIYFTRIIVYLLRMTTPFAWTWLVELFEQTVTLIFYISVGHKFRPFDDNPYLQLPTSEEQEAEDVVMELFNMEEALSQSGMTDGVTRIHRPQNLDAARENRRRREDAANRPLPGDAEAADSDLIPLVRP
ncbi:hypothetical protein TcWFU_007960 [Taenia crassiceps]|uniref:GOST seven transmembrane domain-containing protein n=1 Tax=Taenia crassiceps TaxID=6207 RepID=A0ABR4QIJ3_9CEST